MPKGERGVNLEAVLPSWGRSRASDRWEGEGGSGRQVDAWSGAYVFLALDQDAMEDQVVMVVAGVVIGQDASQLVRELAGVAGGGGRKDVQARLAVLAVRRWPNAVYRSRTTHPARVLLVWPPAQTLPPRPANLGIRVAPGKSCS